MMDEMIGYCGYDCSLRARMIRDFDQGLMIFAQKRLAAISALDL